MACQQSQADYIDAIKNMAELARHVSEVAAGYVTVVQARPLSAIATETDDWRICMESIERLIGEQRASMDAYQRDAIEHSPGGAG